jgi:DNA-binding MarR family transcriptional regulator
MSFFELFDQFFQLEAEQTIPPMAAKLYMYWLHEFNNASPRWPAKLHRRANQVYADLNVDKKTLEKATEQLERRGLISTMTRLPNG